MYQSILSGAYRGMESYLVHVEVDISEGLPCMDMIGYLAGEVKESRERVRVGIKNSGYKMPPKRITISLSPADIRKDGSGFDLAVALGIVMAMEDEKQQYTESKNTRGTDAEVRSNTVVLGELGLDGSVKHVRGVLPILLQAAKEGVRCCVVPRENQKEAQIVKEVKVIAVSTLKEAVEWFCGNRTEEADSSEDGTSINANMNINSNTCYKEDFSQVKGQQLAKRAAEIAAAGLHNILLFGPPGSGKSMIAERIRTILPPMTYEECLEVTKIRSVIGALDANASLIVQRPYERAHPLITSQGLIGGGVVPAPGIVTRAHKGVLFLDELPEFERSKLDMLRQPLEEKRVRIIRSRYVCDYQADFMLVAAMNPCPCGYYPNRERCHCKASEISGYLKRISGPILDRIDISAEVGKVEWEHLHSTEPEESSMQIRERIQNAFSFQMQRNNKFNSNLTNEEIESVCRMSSEAEKMLEFAFRKKEKSVRSFDRIRKVSRTIADLAQSEMIEAEHMAEAIVLNGGMESIMQKGKDLWKETM